MLQFNVLGFPVYVQFWFWLTALFFSGGISLMRGATDDTWVNVALRIAVIFISILIHELGHALAARKYGHSCTIELTGFGGLTHIHHARLDRGQSLWVSFSGPLAGFILAAVAFLPWQFIDTEYDAFYTFFGTLLYINVLWTLLNLLPILPMDGGQIFRELLGPGRLHIACIVGGVLAVLVCVLALSREMIYTAFMFGYFAFINFSNGSAEGGIKKD
jgi:Zn-dependent protease